MSVSFLVGLLLGPLLLLAVWRGGRRGRLRAGNTQLRTMGRDRTYKYDWETERDLRDRQIEDLRRVKGKQFMDFCDGVYQESLQRGVNIWQVYSERAYTYYVQAQWDAWILAWSAIGRQVRIDTLTGTHQDPGDEA